MTVAANLTGAGLAGIGVGADGANPTGGGLVGIGGGGVNPTGGPLVGIDGDDDVGVVMACVEAMRGDCCAHPARSRPAAIKATIGRSTEGRVRIQPLSKG